MDITVGIAKSGRELKLSVDAAEDEITAQVESALSGEYLSLTDEKGRRVLVRAAEIAYVEIGPADSRPVGFTVAS